MTDVHTYTADVLNSGAVRLTCPECKREVVITRPQDGYKRKVIRQGRLDVRHQWGIPGFILSYTEEQ